MGAPFAAWAITIIRDGAGQTSRLSFTPQVRLENPCRDEKLGVHGPTFRMLPLVLAIITAVTITAAAPAHADEVDFIHDLQARGVPIIGVNAPQVMIGRGWTIRAQLGNGESTQTAAKEFGAYFWGQTLADVAQQDLCPDTLR